MNQTPLNKIHKQLGARMCEFTGWEMPIQYEGIGEEHRTVRTKAGIFDVSHMGEIEVQGPQALTFLQKVTCNDVSRLKAGDCQYSAFLTDRGTFVDDIIVNKLGPDHYLICVNASNTVKDFEWIRPQAPKNLEVLDRSDNYFQIALQGPETTKILPVTIKPFTSTRTTVAGKSVLVARTGYTGEDGFEIYGDPKDAESLWEFLMEKGAKPCGLGARDTLRLEAAYPLYGHEIDDSINPFEARLAWIVKMNKGDFIGRTALAGVIGESAEMLLPKMLVGVEMREPGIARQGCKIYPPEEIDGGYRGERGFSPRFKRASGLASASESIGWITSGTLSPFLDRPIALGYVKTPFVPEGAKIDVDIHNKKREAVIVPLPFYKRR